MTFERTFHQTNEMNKPQRNVAIVLTFVLNIYFDSLFYVLIKIHLGGINMISTWTEKLNLTSAEQHAMPFIHVFLYKIYLYILSKVVDRILKSLIYILRPRYILTFHHFVSSKDSISHNFFACMKLCEFCK